MADTMLNLNVGYRFTAKALFDFILYEIFVAAETAETAADAVR